MNMYEFLNSISGAEYVEYNDVWGMFFEWNGSLTIKVWSVCAGSFDNTDVFTMSHPTTVQEAKDSITEYMDRLEEEEPDGN